MSKYSDFIQAQLQAIRKAMPDNTADNSAQSLSMDIFPETTDISTLCDDAAISANDPVYQNQLEIQLGLRDKSVQELFDEKPCYSTLRNIPKREQTAEMVRTAVESDGLAIEAVSKQLITLDLCKVAVMQNGLALQYIPKELLTGEICAFAVKSTGAALEFVPKHFITKQLAITAVRQTIKYGKYDDRKYPIYYVPGHLIDQKLIADSVCFSPCSIRDVPRRFITKELLISAVSGDGEALAYVPFNRISKQLTELAISQNPTNLQFVPEVRRTQSLCLSAFERNPIVLQWIPAQFISAEMCLSLIEQADPIWLKTHFVFEWIPGSLRNEKSIIDALCKVLGAEAILKWNDRIRSRVEENNTTTGSIQPLSESALSYLHAIASAQSGFPMMRLELSEASIPTPESEAILLPAEGNTAITYDLRLNDDIHAETIYYISDLHIEHQLKDIITKENCTREEISTALDAKIAEMIQSIYAPSGYLLIAGDVGHYRGLVSWFYQKMKVLWHGTIICVLGNHELWDSHTKGQDEESTPRSADEIVTAYRKRIKCLEWKNNTFLLQNAVFIKYKNAKECVIEEEQIRNASDQDLRDLCEKSSLIVLGGLGFSGLCEQYNANSGLYRSAVPNLEEDRAQSKRFEFIYNKLLRCASDKQVIVLTHTPVSNWTSQLPHTNWVYINGHTHQNSLIRKPDGTTVLSDNQIGYKPAKWKLNAFTVSGWYDPFEKWENGIYEISSDDYRDFNRGRGIHSNGCHYPGSIFMLKKNKLYMFVLQSTSSLCLLAGGMRKRLENNTIEYYFDHLELYAQKVTEAVTPYRKALICISDEIRHIGGSGIIHGCIVDIDYFSHIYLNPYDGTITPYFAWNVTSRFAYDDLSSLLAIHLPLLYPRYETLRQQGQLPLLGPIVPEEKKKRKKHQLQKYHN